MRVLQQGDEWAALDVEPVAIGFSPVDALAPLARYLAWPYRFLSDPDRVLYRRLGLGRAGVRQVFNSGTRAIYSEAAARGVDVKMPVEDIRQLGGDGVAVSGSVIALWRPSSPDDRPDVEEMLAFARSRFG
ncbi:MAG: hypothetical protein NVS3B21_12570 [Acidimicrobiales bacterium]